MQDRYAGDFGDFVKFVLLRALAGDRRIGLAWWLHPDEGHNADGKHIGYLSRPDLWRHVDPVAFDALAHVIERGERSVAALEAARLLDHVSYWTTPVPMRREGVAARTHWIDEGVARLGGCDLICFDPDNGIDPQPDRRTSPKSIGLDELDAFRATRKPLLVYQHHTRRKGGHIAEVAHLADILRARGFARVDAIRSPRFSPRVFFLLDADAELRSKAERLASAHPTIFEWYPQQARPEGFAATILTLYPEMFPGPLGTSLAGRALREGKWACETLQIRDFATDRHRSVDDTPAGGGAGMVMRADVLAHAVDHARAAHPQAPVLAMSPRGAPLTQAQVRALAAGPGVTILCGRFEGIDERLFEARDIQPVSIGDYILSGGEMAALTLLDACIRLLPGVMGAAHSGDDESFETGLLEYPHYTRPFEWEGRTIPEVLRSGDHARVDAWRKARAEADTRSRRPDLWERHVGARVQPPSGAHDDRDGS